MLELLATIILVVLAINITVWLVSMFFDLD